MKKQPPASKPAQGQVKEDIVSHIRALSDHLLWASEKLHEAINALRGEITENQPPIMRADVLDLCRQLDEECEAKNRSLAWAAELEDRLRAVGEKPPRRRKSGSAQGDVARWPAPRKKK